MSEDKEMRVVSPNAPKFVWINERIVNFNQVAYIDFEHLDQHGRRAAMVHLASGKQLQLTCEEAAGLREGMMRALGESLPSNYVVKK